MVNGSIESIAVALDKDLAEIQDLSSIFTLIFAVVLLTYDDGRRVTTCAWDLACVVRDLFVELFYKFSIRLHFAISSAENRTLRPVLMCVPS